MVDASEWEQRKWKVMSKKQTPLFLSWNSYFLIVPQAWSHRLVFLFHFSFLCFFYPPFVFPVSRIFFYFPLTICHPPYHSSILFYLKFFSFHLKLSARFVTRVSGGHVSRSGFLYITRCLWLLKDSLCLLCLWETFYSWFIYYGLSNNVLFYFKVFLQNQNIYENQ